MFGWRGKIGLLVPSSNTTMEMEFHRSVPRGVSVHTARITMPEVNTFEEKKQAYKTMNEKIEYSSKDLASADVSVVVYGCTSGSIMEGLKHDIQIIQNIGNVVNTHTITVITAIVEAIKSLNLQKISVMTPYVDEINEKEKEFLEHNIPGLEVLSIKGLGIVGNLPKGKLNPFSSYPIIKKWDVNESEGIFISCTNWRTFEIIEYLEKDLKKPVITSNQAALWRALRIIGVKDRLNGLGKLFEN